MSSKTNDRMRRYESNQDSGDTAGDAAGGAANNPQPAVEPLPDNPASDDAPIPMATPQSPVQTEDSPGGKEDNAPESRSNRSGHPGDREYREV